MNIVSRQSLTDYQNTRFCVNIVGARAFLCGGRKRSFESQRQMSKMLRLELLGIVLLACTQILTEHRDFYGSYNQHGHQRTGHRQEWQDDTMIKEVRVKEGRLRGMVLRPTTNKPLQLVDVFLGIPYAEPPVGSLRFSPPRSPQPWRHVRKAQEFAPVCPQVLPNLRLEVKPGRHEYLERLLPYLRNQSEDCLYLNIYAPHQYDGPGNPRRYPVMVFIQGESFEWNSGNPYDGTVISAYGNIVFVTINFRLGILGFLRPGTSDDAASNFGLLDQTAALLWLRDNIAKFGGDPGSMTLVGHGTGAIFANLLLISPVANNKGLFRRAILMSGSALSSDAIGKAPLQITQQVAIALNCPANNDNDLALCLRNRDLDSLLNVKIDKPRYVPAYAPLIDRAVIPLKPLTLMENAHLFGGFDLMYGVTESEKYHLLSPIEALHGMLDQERDNVLRDHAKATHELEPELALTKILEHYGDFKDGYAGEYTMRNRDLVLDAISDSGTVAPLMTVADLHSQANPKSYMYVFSHPKVTQDYSEQGQRTVHGEELPYILGVPLDGGRYHSSDRYTNGEKLFSEAMMTWWCNFAHTGNPNAPRRLSYVTGLPKDWMQYEADWPEYNRWNRTYFNITIPPKVGTKYRYKEMEFWNDDLPNLIRHRPKSPRPTILVEADRNDNHSTETHPRLTDSSAKDASDSQAAFPYNRVTKNPTNDVTNDTADTTENNPVRGSSAITMVIGFGVVFLLINVTAFFYLYRRRHSLKSKEKKARRRSKKETDEENVKKTKVAKQNQRKIDNSVEMGQKSDSKPDVNEVIKNDKAYDNNSNFGRRSKLSRHNSSSTIDTHIKVKEWIQQEIVHRCSPRFLRKTRETLAKEHQEKMSKQQQHEEEENQRRQEAERTRDKKSEPIYDQSPALIVRPGKKAKPPKVSVAVDATPAMRTESILNQIPIELVKDLEMIKELGARGPDDQPSKPQIVVIEHHHSRSDPLPMENVFKCVKPNFSTNRIYESDSESASSLYAKINPKLKTRLQRPGPSVTPEENCQDESERVKLTPDEDIYGKGIVTKLTTFGSNEYTGDINVTCREPVVDIQITSPEEALKTIKRRNYPKVLPDIEKRRSLPAPNSLLLPKLYGTLSKDHRHGPGIPFNSGNPPPPPPRMFGTSKSLDLAEECEERDPITTNLHVGPLLKRQDSITRNSSESNLIDSFERVAIDAQEVLSNHRHDYPDNLGSGGISTNPKCPVHGGSYDFVQSNATNDPSTSQSVDCLDRNLGNPNWYRAKESSSATSKGTANSSLPNIIGNPNWYKPSVIMENNGSEPSSAVGTCILRNNLDTEMKHSAEPKIVITPRVGNLLGQAGQNLAPIATGLKDFSQEPRIIITPRIVQPDQSTIVDKHKFNDSRQIESAVPVIEQNKGSSNHNQTPAAASSFKDERNEPKIIISAKDTRNPMIGGTSSKQPKIIIKPTTNLARNREQRNIPKVSAIPSPEVQNYNPFEKDTKGPERPNESIQRLEKPPIKDKPKITRIPSFSRRKDEKSDASQRSVTTGTSKVEKSNIPCLSKIESDSSASTSNSSNSNTNTIKRKPVGKK